MTLRGQCLCGKVQYTLVGDPIATAICHCTNCQRQSGSAFSVNLMALEQQLTIEGELSGFRDQGDSGNPVVRKFCSACGSPIISVPEAMPGLVALKAGTLDEHSSVAPSLQVFCGSKQSWLELPGITAFEANPPSG
ncbi:MAG: GFA family protein [Pseudomonadota bacterium]